MNFINKLAAWLEKHLLPVATKMGNQKHLAALRDGFIATLPVALMGAMITMFNWVIMRPDSLLGKLNSHPWYANSVQPFWNKYFLPINGQIWWGTLAMSVIFTIVGIAYSLAKSYEVDGLTAAIIALACYLIITPQVPDILDPKSPWGAISWNSFNSTAIFTGIITAMVATEIYRKVIQKGWVIRMPEQVPPAVAKAFSAVIPGGIAMFVFGIVGAISINHFHTSIKIVIERSIQAPLTTLGQSPATMIFLVALSQIFWFFGLHGMNIVGPILDTMYAPAIQQNLEAITVHHTAMPNVLTRNFIDVYAMHGGSGCTLALIICIFLFSKREEYKELAKLSVAPGIFQINEPITYGLPMVLNPLMFIPFILSPVITLFIAWLFTGPIPFAGRIYIAAPWVMPPILSAFLATGGSLTATILAAITFAISIVIYAPFVIIANRQVVETENGKNVGM